MLTITQIKEVFYLTRLCNVDSRQMKYECSALAEYW
jgi:hypothetical protein